MGPFYTFELRTGIACLSSLTLWPGLLFSSSLLRFKILSHIIIAPLFLPMQMCSGQYFLVFCHCFCSLSPKQVNFTLCRLIFSHAKKFWWIDWISIQQSIVYIKDCYKHFAYDVQGFVWTAVVFWSVWWKSFISMSRSFGCWICEK